MIKKAENKLKEEYLNYPYWTLNDRQICDLELILNGGFEPLNGFLGKRAVSYTHLTLPTILLV